MLRPSNINEQEREALIVALEGLLRSEKYHVENSFVGKVGSDLINHILKKLNKPATKSTPIGDKDNE